MKSWSTAVFPITITTVLAGLTFWLLHATALKEESSDGKDRHDPDYMISGMQLNKLDKTGNLQYTLTATEARHYPDDDSTNITAPHLVYLNPKKPTLTVSAKAGEISSEGETVILRDDVQLKRDPTPLRAALFGYMPDLTVRTEEETAFTQSSVLFTQGKSWFKGDGMHLDNKTQTFVLKSRAAGQFESRKAKSKP